jgi:fatty acid desaturase
MPEPADPPDPPPRAERTFDTGDDSTFDSSADEARWAEAGSRRDAEARERDRKAGRRRVIWTAVLSSVGGLTLAVLVVLLTALALVCAGGVFLFWSCSNRKGPW